VCAETWTARQRETTAVIIDLENMVAKLRVVDKGCWTLRVMIEDVWKVGAAGEKNQVE
jgi:hypothetical protein